MGQSLNQIYVHIAFSTKHRAELIDDEIAEPLFVYLGGILKGVECNPIQVGGYRNHVHILCLLSKKITQMDLLEVVKKKSSKWIKTIDSKYYNFYWQGGYAIFSCANNRLESIKRYIVNQKNHHQ